MFVYEGGRKGERERERERESVCECVGVVWFVSGGWYGGWGTESEAGGDDGRQALGDGSNGKGDSDLEVVDGPLTISTHT